MIKFYCLVIVVSLFRLTALACDACQKQQPAVLRNVWHGGSPDSQWDYVIVGAAALVVVLTLFYSLKWLVRPGERELNHIKQQILL